MCWNFYLLHCQWFNLLNQQNVIIQSQQWLTYMSRYITSPRGNFLCIVYIHCCIWSLVLNICWKLVLWGKKKKKKVLRIPSSIVYQHSSRTLVHQNNHIRTIFRRQLACAQHWQERCDECKLNKNKKNRSGIHRRRAISWKKRISTSDGYWLACAANFSH